MYLSRGCLAALSILAVAAVGNAQTKSYPTFKRFTVPVTESSSTIDVQPQIQPDVPFSVREVAAENDYTPPLPRERANSLIAGSMRTTLNRGALKARFPGPTDGRLIPPDCNMAVGPNQIVTIINASLAFYSKTGTKTFQQTLDGANGFFNGIAQTGFVFDPKAFYDPISNRFFVVALDLNEGSNISNFLVAVSDDNNPSGTWYKYRINNVLADGGRNYWLDYPGFGFNKDAIALSGNMFQIGGGGYFGVQVFSIRKSDLLTGGTAQISVMKEPGTGTVQLTRTTDVNSNFIFGLARGGGNAMRVYAVQNPASTSPILKEFDVPVPAYNSPPGPAPSLGNQLDTLDGRVFNSSFRVGRIVGAHNISNGGGGTMVRWYDVKVNTWPTSGSPSLFQSGNINLGGGIASHMPAINMNAFEDISVYYTRSSSSIAADLVQSSRVKTDPLGSLGAPQLLSSSTGSYRGGRWGDYFSCEVDPADDSTFWGFGMAIDAAGNYRTEISKWTVTVGGGAGTVVDATSVTTVVGSFIVGTAASVALSDDIFYQVGSVSDAQLGQAAGIEATFVVPTETAHIQVKMEAIGTAPGATTMVYGWNWSANRYDLIASTPLGTSGNTAKFVTIPDANVGRFMDATGNVKLMIRSHIPRRPFGGNPSPFTYRADQIQLAVR